MPQQQQPKSNCAIGDLRAAMQSCLETTCDALLIAVKIMKFGLEQMLALLNGWIMQQLLK